MLEVFRSLVGTAPGRPPARKPAAELKSKPVDPARDYRAVSLAPGLGCMAAAKSAAEKRYLLREAPRLPLRDCTMSASCSCKFRKHADRRNADRRLLGNTVNTWFAGAEKRQLRRGRRTN